MTMNKLTDEEMKQLSEKQADVVFGAIAYVKARDEEIAELKRENAELKKYPLKMICEKCNVLIDVTPHKDSEMDDMLKDFRAIADIAYKHLHTDDIMAGIYARCGEAMSSFGKPHKHKADDRDEVEERIEHETFFQERQPNQSEYGNAVKNWPIDMWFGAKSIFPTKTRDDNE